jgi:hypothetical protein
MFRILCQTNLARQNLPPQNRAENPDDCGGSGGFESIWRDDASW